MGGEHSTRTNSQWLSRPFAFGRPIEGRTLDNPLARPRRPGSSSRGLQPPFSGCLETDLWPRSARTAEISGQTWCNRDVPTLHLYEPTSGIGRERGAIRSPFGLVVAGTGHGPGDRHPLPPVRTSSENSMDRIGPGGPGPVGVVDTGPVDPADGSHPRCQLAPAVPAPLPVGSSIARTTGYPDG